MNIFYVHKDPFKAASMLPDKLVVKMPLESAQMLSTAHRFITVTLIVTSKVFIKLLTLTTLVLFGLGKVL